MINKCKAHLQIPVQGFILHPISMTAPVLLQVWPNEAVGEPGTEGPNCEIPHCKFLLCCFCFNVTIIQQETQHLKKIFI